MKDEMYDVIIVGGSYSGLAAAMALGRAARRVLVIDSGIPCNSQTPYSHNFLTQDGKAPAEIAAVARQQVGMYPTVELMEGRVINCRGNAGSFEVEIQAGLRLRSRTIVFATGISDTMADIPGFAQCWGISVLHCPYCHGYEVRQQKTGLLGNGPAGFEFAALLSNWASELTMFTNGPAEFTDAQRSKLASRRISVVETGIRELLHTNGRLDGIEFTSGARSSLNVLYARRPFVQHCRIPQALGCELTEEGYLKVDAAQKTTVSGVYACGDNASRMRTVANAVASGTTTGMMVNKELIERDF